MTVKLYENNVLQKSCSCVVEACEEKDGLYLVQVDQTVFFPEGGGQLSDKGKLGEAMVSHVSEKNGCIYHECDRPLEIGSTVEAVLDWRVRMDRMQQHCGEHILSYAFYKLFNANNVGFHMREDSVGIDLDKEVTYEELRQAEQLTNEIIWENRPVHVEYMDSQEAAKLADKMRKFNSNLKGLLRIVTVEDADVCTCCGTHPPFTGMVGCVKIIKAEKHKQGSRVEFLCGNRAMEDAAKKNDIVLQLARDFSAKPEAVLEYFDKYKAEMESLKNSLKQKSQQLLEVEFDKALAVAPLASDGTRILCLPMEVDAKDIKLLLPRVNEIEKLAVVLMSVQPQRISYICTIGKATDRNSQQIIRLVNETFGGRGGGKPDCAQGGSNFCADWREKLQQVEAKLL